MRYVRPIPRRLLPDTCLVRVEGDDGWEETTLSGVRFEKTLARDADTGWFADAGRGTVWVDAANTGNAFEVPVGARVEIGGRWYVVRECMRLEDVRGHVHHWELAVA